MRVEKKILLWHARLGHPSFSYLKYLYPDLFHNKEPTDFKCDVCALSKQQKAHFPSSLYKPSEPFALIHSDIWGP